ncbi:hypothetical protein KP77_10320 [Jeotgalibacillus alimentarius]|uniref:Uncharacterized protein n=1 Tax=Jeotgalibacillus alimentarius TaxID=135826 RepID=A0A0C2RMR6_9BACL|nr:hypothetical protein [Jeotgalibacillus alimentarius]KIL51520.1 hypothetical protein KP77_10320 [Jeotgalibacillus alimentarius]
MEKTLERKQLDLRKKLDEKRKLEKRLVNVRSQLVEHEQKKKELEQSLSEEQLDLHKMDRFSLVNVVRKWKGTHEELREKEYDEAAKAELKLNEHEKMLKDLKGDKTELEHALSAYTTVEDDWESFLKEKERWIKQNDGETAQEINLHLDHYADLGALLTEIDEAIYAGRSAESALETALSKLRSAHGMSTWDTFLGGGMIVTAMKHSDLDQSQDALHRAQRNLRKFESELKDVKEGSAETMNVERGSFITFADYFLDDIFSEWTIHSRINESISKVEDTKYKVARAVGNLQKERGQILHQQEEVWDRYQQCIEHR